SEQLPQRCNGDKASSTGSSTSARPRSSDHFFVALHQVATTHGRTKPSVLRAAARELCVQRNAAAYEVCSSQCYSSKTAWDLKAARRRARPLFVSRIPAAMGRARERLSVAPASDTGPTASDSQGEPARVRTRSQS